MWIISTQDRCCHIVNHIVTVQVLKINYLWQLIRTNTAGWHVPSRGTPQKWTKSTLTWPLIWRLSLCFLAFVSLLEFKWLSSCSMFSDISRFRPLHQSNSLRHVPATELSFYFYHGKSNPLVSLYNSHRSWRIKTRHWEDTNMRNSLLFGGKISWPICSFDFSCHFVISGSLLLVK